MVAPRLTMVGHAGVVVESGPAVLWTDPWLQSSAFNEGWALHPEPVMPDALLDRVTHIWISHEHPDHFNVPTLRALPEAVRRRVTVLYQQHFRRDVVEWLRRHGFSVVELEAGRTTHLRGATVTCHPVGHEDSALVIDAGGQTLLELNDCKPTDRQLRRLVHRHGPIHVLLDQFSGAGWNGNPGDRARKQRQAALVRGTFARHVEIVDPDWVVPFASFVRFAHAENAHVDEERVTLDDAIDAVPGHSVAVLFPGDTWSLDGPWLGTDEARQRYRADDDGRADLPLATSEPVDADAIVEAARAMVRRFADEFHVAVRRSIPPVQFSVVDHGRPVCDLTVSLIDGVTVHDTDDDADGNAKGGAATTIHLGSQAAWNTFAMRWGLSTLWISGRFSINGPEAPLLRLKELGAASAVGYRSHRPGRLLRDPRFRAMARRQVADRVGRIRP